MVLKGKKVSKELIGRVRFKIAAPATHLQAPPAPIDSLQLGSFVATNSDLVMTSTIIYHILRDSSCFIALSLVLPFFRLSPPFFLNRGSHYLRTRDWSWESWESVKWTNIKVTNNCQVCEGKYYIWIKLDIIRPDDMNNEIYLCCNC